MRILILGSGARENALYCALQKSNLSEIVYVLPGNAGIQSKLLVKGVSVIDFDSILKFVKLNNINLLVVGPEIPLALGIKDFFIKYKPDTLVFGPDAKAAKLEASKSFAIKYMQQNDIPTAKSHISYLLDDALKIVQKHALPIVIKADGLAGGKGVSIHYNREEVKNKLTEIFVDKFLGKAGNSIIIQSFMKGKEASLFAICNGKEAIYLPATQDYKPIFENNQGPNTGGMGAHLPTEHLTEEQISFVHKKIVTPILKDFSYTGVLYIGLMIHSNDSEDISVVEFNCRFGDPEIQTILAILETDILPYFLWACGHSKMIPKVKANGFYYIPFKNKASVNVVLSAKGYPGNYSKNIIFSLPKIPDKIQVIHATTSFCNRNRKGNIQQYFSQGGRILNIIATDYDINTARDLAYSYLDDFSKINFNQISNFYFRKDIALLPKRKNL